MMVYKTTLSISIVYMLHWTCKGWVLADGNPVVQDAHQVLVETLESCRCCKSELDESKEIIQKIESVRKTVADMWCQCDLRYFCFAQQIQLSCVGS